MKRTKTYLMFLCLIILSGLVFLLNCATFADDWTSLYNTVDKYYRQGKYDQALVYCDHALKLAERDYGKDNIAYASTINYRALLYQQLDKSLDAEKDYTVSIMIFKDKKGEESVEYGRAIHNMAILYQSMKRLNEAEPLFKKALNIFKKQSNQCLEDYADCLNNLATLYIDLKRPLDADPLYQEATKLYSGIGDAQTSNYIATLYNRAKLCMSQEQYSKAEPIYQEILKYNKDKFGENKPEYAHALNNLAIVYQYLGNYSEAETNFIKASQIYSAQLGEKHQHFVRTQKNLARLYDIMGKFNESKILWDFTTNIYLNQVSTFFPSMSEAEKTKFYNTICPIFEEYLSFVVKWKDKDPSLISQMYNNQLATKALLLNSVNKIKRRIFDSGDSSLIDKYNQWINIKESLSKFYQLSKLDLEKRKINIPVFELKSNQLEKELSLKSELFAKEFTKAKVVWENIRDVLSDGEAAIEIVRFRHFDKKWTDKVYYAAMIITKDTKSQPDLIIMDNGNELEREFISSYNKMIKFQIDDEDSYNQYWGKIEAKLVGIKKAYVSLDGVYNQINLATLQMPEDKYLIDNQNIQVVNNTKDIIDYIKFDQINPENNAELFGYPNYEMEDKTQLASASNSTRISTNTDIPVVDNIKLNGKINKMVNLVELPGTEVEIKQIAEILKIHNWKYNVNLWDKAQKDQVKTVKSPKVLHIATHGYFFADVDRTLEGEDLIKETKVYGIDAGKVFENPLLRSGLFFAGAGTALSADNDKGQLNDNGILTAYEAMNLDLDKTELVVLSACETGLGEVRNGEGVYGLQRALQVAGAKSIIMSLWKVNDEATQELMATFYDKWLETGDKKTAFKDAQIYIRSKYKWPYYWGAFLMVGN